MQEQLSKDLITMSDGPQGWQSLAQLSVIKQRNKPKEPPKKPKAAPFFLPVQSGLEPKLIVPESEDDKDQINKTHTSRILNLHSEAPRTNFLHLLDNKKCM